MLSASTYSFPCPRCGNPAHSGMPPLNETGPAMVCCPVCRTLVPVPRFGNREPIAAGDVAQIFRAVDRQLGRVVALKSFVRVRMRERASRNLGRRTTQEPGWLEQETCSMEYRLRMVAAGLRAIPPGPHIPRLLDFCEDAREFIFVMEFLEGNTLDRLLLEEGPIDRQAAATIVRGLLAALQAIHAAGFGHGNIRPEHILFRTENGNDLSTPVLCGFGLDAYPLPADGSDPHSAPSACPAPGIISPARTDLRSVGRVFHAMVAGIDAGTRPASLAAMGAGWTAGFIRRLLHSSASGSFATAAEGLMDMDSRLRRRAVAAARFPCPAVVNIPNLSERLYIMPATACNLRCRFCGYGKMSLARQIMPNDLFVRVVTEACGFGFTRFGLTPMVGEALLDPCLPDKLEFLERFPAVDGYSFCTNFIPTGPPFIGRLLGLRKLQWLSISICGHDHTSFAALTGAAPELYDRLLDNLEYLSRTHPRPFPLEIRMRTARSFDPGAHTTRLGQLLRLFAAQSARIRIPHDMYSNRGGLISPEDLAGLDITLKTEIPKGNSPCVFLFYKHTVLPDGRLNACYTGDVNATLVIGDLSTQTFEEIYALNNEPYLDLIRGQLRGRFPAVCSRCTDYRSVADTHYSFRYHEKRSLLLSDFLDQLGQ
jgi:hypothetical protein